MVHGNLVKKGKGELPQHENVECIICLENKLCVEQALCDHKICVNCFKRCYYGELEYPKFPYPEMQEEFCEDPENEKWLNYPLIKEWDNLIDILSDIRDEKYKNEEYLRQCPICRSKN